MLIYWQLNLQDFCTLFKTKYLRLFSQDDCIAGYLLKPRSLSVSAQQIQLTWLHLEDYCYFSVRIHALSFSNHLGPKNYLVHQFNKQTLTKWSIILGTNINMHSFKARECIWMRIICLWCLSPFSEIFEMIFWEFNAYYGLNIYTITTTQIHVEMLTPRVIRLGSGAFGR